MATLIGLAGLWLVIALLVTVIFSVAMRGYRESGAE